MSKIAKSVLGNGSVPKPTTPSAASRVQTAAAIKNGGTVSKGSQASRMQRAAVRNFGKFGSK